MANLTNDYRWVQKGEGLWPAYAEYAGVAGVTYYQGGLVYRDSAGVLKRIPAATGAVPAAGIEAIGWVHAQSYLVPTTGAQKIPIIIGIWHAMLNSSDAPVDISMRNKVVYAENDHTVRSDDGGGIYAIAGVLFDMQYGIPQVRVGGPNVSASAASSPSAFFARGVYYGNASLTAFDVDNANADGLTYVAGDVVLLVAQTAAGENGPYVVGAVETGTAPLVRPAWWPTGGAIQNGIVIEVGAGGTHYGPAGSSWKALCTGAMVIDTDDPLFYPREYVQTITLASGTYTIGLASTATPDEPLFVFSTTKTGISITRGVAGTPHTDTVEYRAATITAGKAGAAALVVRADIAAGTINASDASILNVSVRNW
jgi:hypothetical protein